MKDTFFLYMLFTTTLLPYAEFKHFHSFAGPFRVEVKRITRCPDGIESANKIVFYWHDVRTNRMQKNLILSGNATVPFTVDNSLSGHLTMASWSSMGGWKENAFHAKSPRECDVLNNMLPTLWHPWLLSVFGELIPCPISPGIYRFTNWICSWNQFPVQYFFYGRWRMDFTLIHPNGDVGSCGRFFLDTLPE